MILFKIGHKDYVHGWQDYRKTASYRNGARWNSREVPVMYLSSNIQNAMLELANYSVSPKMANKLFRIAVFEFEDLRVSNMEPGDLPRDWDSETHIKETQGAGDKLLRRKNFDGFFAPSVAINNSVVMHPELAVRGCAYANVVVNIEQFGIGKVTLKDVYSPVFSPKMFSE